MQDCKLHKQIITYPIAGGIVSLLLSPTRIPDENRVKIKELVYDSLIKRSAEKRVIIKELVYDSLIQRDYR